MKKFHLKNAQMLAMLAVMVTTVVANSACFFIMHQEVMPENAKKLRKF